MAFPKTGEGFFPFWKMRERHASFSPSSLLPSVMPVKKRRKKKEGKGGRLYIFYGMAERAMVSRRKGGSGGGFIYFFRYIRLGFFRSGKPGHGLGSIFLRMAGGPFVAFVGFGVKNGGPNGKAEKRGCFITDSLFPFSLSRFAEKKQKAKE